MLFCCVIICFCTLTSFVKPEITNELKETKVAIIAANNTSDRIVSGVSATKGQFPYQVALRVSIFGTVFCGGFIINEQWIGTAGETF